MKKLISLLLALLMVLGTVSALADAKLQYNKEYELYYTETVKNGVTVTSYYEDAEGKNFWFNEYTTSELKDGYWVTTYYHDESATKKWYETAENGGKKTYTTIYTDYDYDSGKKTSTWVDIYNYDDKSTDRTIYSASDELMNVYHFDEKGNYAKVDGNGQLSGARITIGNDVYYFSNEDYNWYVTDGNGTKQIVDPSGVYGDLIKDALKALEEQQGKKKKHTVENPVWYTNNTACVHGISLRDTYPGLTSKWYNVLPVDLSTDGTQTFELIASNIYHLGTINVTVKGDEVTATYSYLNGRGFYINAVDECLAWFKSVDEITGSYLENPTANAQFGKAISKANDLGGQDVALLFVCNHVSYRIPLNNAGAEPTRFWRNSTKFDAYYANISKLMDKLANQQTAVVETK